MFNNIEYSFVASDTERKVNVIRTVSNFRKVEIRKIKDELMRFDYNTRKLVSCMDVLDHLYTAEITIVLDKTPHTEFANMMISSLEFKEGDDELKVKVDGNTIRFDTDFNPTSLGAMADLIALLYTPR